MEHYIISPWFIYLLGIIDNIPGLFNAIAFLIFVMMGLEYVKNILFLKKYTINKFLLSIFIFLIVITRFIPDKNTLMTIYACKTVTVEFVEKAYDTSKHIGKDLRQFTLDFIKDLIAVVKNADNGNSSQVYKKITSGDINETKDHRN